ncbi:MAG: MinD/ParA family protein [Gammaproteobacteria bacterium]|nr:MinD/ParA family protein [Gammaproteobacteria bacterium]
MATVIAITSGKGGVGKTHIAVNLGVALARRGSRVCLFDADTGLANVNILLGISPARTIEQVVTGEYTVGEVMATTPWGLHILPGASGVERCAELAPAARGQLVDALGTLERNYDHIIIDTAAGVTRNVLDFVDAAEYKVLVITPEPTALTDAFSLLKLALSRGSRAPFYVVVNRAPDYQTSRRVHGRFLGAVKKYLKSNVNYLGFVAADTRVEQAVRNQVPVVVWAPDSRAAGCLDALADIVHRQFLNHAGPGGFSTYWRERATRAPKESRSGSAAPQPSLEQAVARLVDYLTADLTSPAEAARLLAPLLEAYERRCPSRSGSVTGDLFGHLHRKGYPESELKELIFTLEGIYEKTQGRPVRNAESIAALLLSDRRRAAEGTRWLRHALDALERN